MTYVVGRNPKVNEQIRSLAEAAKTLGISDLFRDALVFNTAKIVQILEIKAFPGSVFYTR